MKTTTDNKKMIKDIYGRLYRRFGPQGWWPGRTRFEVIIGAILTQNTAWTNVEKAIRNLRAERLLSPIAMERIPQKELAGLIRPAGYYNIKARRLKNFISFLFSKYGGSLDKASSRQTELLRGELLAVNGIGHETCNSILLYAFKKPVFVVDAYTRRIFSRHHLLRDTASYEEVQKFFMDALPRNERLYGEYHALLVRLAKEHCRKNPDCDNCPLSGM